MAEIVGLVASIAALVEVTGKVTTYCYYYFGAIKNAPKEITSLCDELNLLKVVLEQLDQQVKITDPQAPTAQVLSGLKIPLQKCLAEISTLQSKIKPRTSTKFSKVLSRCRWPLKASETCQTISELERYKSLFQLALTSDQLFLSRMIQLFTRETNEAVVDLVQVVEKEFAAQRLKRQEDEALRAGKTRMKLFNWLYPNEYDLKHIEISRRRQKQTGGWLLRDPRFDSWVRGSGPRLLWAHGIPGAGKTYLSSLVIDELECRAIQSPKCGLAYIYFNYKQQNDQTPTNVIGSLIKQLWTNSPTLAAVVPHDIESLYHKYASQGTSKMPEIEELKSALLAVMKLLDTVFFVFDALDECHEEEQRKELLPIFDFLISSGANIFLTSRPHPKDINKSLSSRPNRIAKVEILAKEEDITIYIKEKIAGNTHASELIHGKLREEVISTLVNSCKGMFLLVYFYIEHLCQQTTENQIRKALKDLNASLASGTQSSLDLTYSRAISNIRRQHPARTTLAFKILAWLVNARRPLTIDELRHGVAVESDMRDIEDADMAGTGMILDVCGGLVTIDENSGIASLAHYSVQEYLEGSSTVKECSGFGLEVITGCLNLFSLGVFAGSTFSSSSTETPRDTLLKYAATNIHTHVQNCDEDLSTEAVVRFLRNSSSVNVYVDAYDRYMGWKDHTELGNAPLHIASFWNHIKAMTIFLDEGAYVSSRNKYGSTPLHSVAQYGCIGAARLLLERGADMIAVDRVGLSPMHVAALYDRRDIVNTVLSYSCELGGRYPGSSDPQDEPEETTQDYIRGPEKPPETEFARGMHRMIAAIRLGDMVEDYFDEHIKQQQGASAEEIPEDSEACHETSESVDEPTGIVGILFSYAMRDSSGACLEQVQEAGVEEMSEDNEVYYDLPESVTEPEKYEVPTNI